MKCSRDGRHLLWPPGDAPGVVLVRLYQAPTQAASAPVLGRQDWSYMKKANFLVLMCFFRLPRTLSVPTSPPCADRAASEHIWGLSMRALAATGRGGETRLHVNQFNIRLDSECIRCMHCCRGMSARWRGTAAHAVRIEWSIGRPFL